MLIILIILGFILDYFIGHYYSRKFNIKNQSFILYKNNDKQKKVYQICILVFFIVLLIIYGAGYLLELNVDLFNFIPLIIYSILPFSAIIQLYEENKYEKNKRYFYASTIRWSVGLVYGLLLLLWVIF